MQTQEQWEVYQTNNEIEQIWYSSRKISDKMQVRDKVVSWIITNVAGAGVYYDNDNTPKSAYVLVWFSIDETFWNTDYELTSEGIRIPLCWWYHITWYAYWWNGWVKMKFQLRVNEKTIIEIITNSTTTTRPIDITLNLWKFDMLAMYVHIENNGGISPLSWTAYAQLNITKI